MSAEPSVLLVTKGLDLGGIERIVADLAIGLHHRGQRVAVAIVNPARDRLVPAIERAGVEVHRLGGTDRIGWRAPNRLRRLHDSADIIHAHGPAVASVVRLVAARRSVVSTAHTPWHSVDRRSRAAWRATYRRDAATVAVGHDVAATTPGCSTVIEHGVDHRLAVELRAAHTRVADSGPLHAITVASHRDAKNYPNLLHAIAHARRNGAPVRLVAIGEGPGFADHRRLAAQLGIADAIDFRPPVDDVMCAMAAADVLVVASDYEGQPIVVREALAVGTPVVATRVGTVTQLVDDGVGRTVEPGDPAGLADVLAELAQSRPALESLRNEARTRPIARTLDDVLDDHQRLYRSVVT